MKALTIIIVFGTLLLVSPSPSPANPLTFTALLNGPSENPPNASPGTGFATAVLDTTLHTLAVSATFNNLLGVTTAAHIHCCTAPPGNIGVATQVPTFLGFPLGVTSGTYVSPIFNTHDLTTYNPSFINNFGGGTATGAEAALLAGLQAGNAYFNIHTATSDPTKFPGGEIRGFLVQSVPESGTLGLMLIGLGALGLTAWIFRDQTLV